ncbi:MAG: hypothetical protein A2X46_12615 [Lentisphaerae bacterium GWF2_57_35]|nr:MAG: hypothetical protein A2X46_12615 [Lentisphaerae bacterium GWF2_57_35]
MEKPSENFPIIGKKSGSTGGVALPVCSGNLRRVRSVIGVINGQWRLSYWQDPCAHFGGINGDQRADFQFVLKLGQCITYDGGVVLGIKILNAELYYTGTISLTGSQNGSKIKVVCEYNPLMGSDLFEDDAIWCISSSDF